MAKPLATRDAFGDAIVDEAKLHKNIVVLGLDLNEATRIEKFVSTYPERFFNMGIAEADGISTAAGMALQGDRPFVTSFASFLTGRYDQIRQSVAGNRAGVVLVGSHGGLAIGFDGNTQMGLEDINLMRGLPFMNVIQPADYIEMYRTVQFLVNSDIPCYLRICRQPVPEINKPDYKFVFGKGVTLTKGKDLTIIATGGVVYIALEVATELAKKNIEIRVINIHTIKPIDRDIILKAAKETKGIFTVEDHSINGGLGSAVAEIVAEQGLAKPVKRWGVNDIFGESGNAKDLYRKHKLDKEGILDEVLKFYKKLKKV